MDTITYDSPFVWNFLIMSGNFLNLFTLTWIVATLSFFAIRSLEESEGFRTTPAQNTLYQRFQYIFKLNDEDIDEVSTWIAGALCYSVFLSYLPQPFSPEALLFLTGFIYLGLIASYFDIKYTMIPDEVSIAGTLTGLLVAPLFLFHQVYPFPTLETKPITSAILSAIFGGVLASGITLITLQAGKLFFGKLEVKSEHDVDIIFNKDGNFTLFDPEDPEDPSHIDPKDYLSRKSDKLVIQATQIKVTKKEKETETFQKGQILLNGKTVLLKVGEDSPFQINPNQTNLSAKTRYMSVPREAMGLGDVKLMAFLGTWAGGIAGPYIMFIAAPIALLSTVINALPRLFKTALKLKDIIEKDETKPATSSPSQSEEENTGIIPFGPSLCVGTLLLLAYFQIT